MSRRRGSGLGIAVLLLSLALPGGTVRAAEWGRVQGEVGMARSMRTMGRVETLRTLRTVAGWLMRLMAEAASGEVPVQHTQCGASIDPNGGCVPAVGVAGAGVSRSAVLRGGSR